MNSESLKGSLANAELEREIRDQCSQEEDFQGMNDNL